MISFKRLRLNQVGTGHVELVIALLAVGVVGLVGYRVFSSSAASLPALNKHDCTLMGRVYNDNNGNCKKSCASGQGSYVTTSTYDYCSGAVSKASAISASKCGDLGRVKLASAANYVGCARRADQKTTANAPQCKTDGATYTVASPNDKCEGTLLKGWTYLGTSNLTRTPGGGVVKAYGEACTFGVGRGYGIKARATITESSIPKKYMDDTLQVIIWGSTIRGKANLDDTVGNSIHPSVGSVSTATLNEATTYYDVSFGSYTNSKYQNGYWNHFSLSSQPTANDSSLSLKTCN